jgi:hypothetical protein
MARTPRDHYELSDAEKRDLIQLIQAGKPLPEKYRFLLFEEVRFLVEGLIADFNVHREVGPNIEWRVDVNQLEAAGVLDLLAERSSLQTGQYQLVVAPYQLIRPAFLLAPASIEQVLLPARFLSWLVHML